MHVRSSFLRFPAISAESHCEKAKSSTAAAQPFLPDCKKVFHLISGSVCACVCVRVCMLASVYSCACVCVFELLHKTFFWSLDLFWPG